MSRKKGIKDVEFTEDVILAAIPGSYGIMTDIAKVLGCSPKTLERAKKKYPRVAAAFRDADLELKDLAEGVLIRNLKKGDIATTIFVNKTRNRDRGYEEKPKLAGMEGVFTIKWQGEDKKDGRINGPV